MSRIAATITLVVVVVAGALAFATGVDDGAPGGGEGGAPVEGFEVTSGAWRTGAGGDATTSSPTFRVRSERTDLASPEVRLRFRIAGYREAGEPSHDWDGVHVGLRYSSPDDLYYVSVARRDGTIAVKRKAGGEYETLAVVDHPVSVGDWHEAVVSVEDTTAGVRVRLVLDGDEALVAVDDAEPLPPGGRVSLRSDNVDVAFDDVDVGDASSA